MQIGISRNRWVQLHPLTHPKDGPEITYIVGRRVEAPLVSNFVRSALMFGWDAFPPCALCFTLKDIRLLPGVVFETAGAFREGFRTFWLLPPDGGDTLS